MLHFLRTAKGSLQCQRLSMFTKSRVGIKEKLELIKFPEKLRGTIVEQWADYWKGLFKDYHEVYAGVIQDIRSKPIKSAALASLCGCAGYIVHLNPDEKQFRDIVLEYNNKIGLVGPAIRNQAAVDHLAYIEAGYNANIVRRLNLGFLSILWLDNYDNTMGLYKAQCKYIDPVYVNFSSRILDVGFIGKWWILEDRMLNFDVNPKEWSDSSTDDSN